MNLSVFVDPQPPLEPPFVATVPSMLHWLADRYGHREAQVRGSQRIGFRDLERQSAAMARGLLARGVGKGARIALLMPNGPDFTVAFMAAARIGALVAPLSTLYQARELGWVLRQGDFDLLLTVDQYLRHDYLARLEEALPSLKDQGRDSLMLPEAPLLRGILVWGECGRGWATSGPAALADALVDRPRIDDEMLAAVEAQVVASDLLCMIFTSGSTAEPKGVVHSHGPMLRHNWQKAHVYWNLSDGDRVIAPRPHFWVAGLAASLFQGLLAGCCLIEPQGLDSAAVLELIQSEAATGACGDTSWLQGLSTDPVLEAAGYKAFRPSLETVAFARRTETGWRYLNPARADREPVPTQTPIALLARSYGMTETLSGHTSIPAGEPLPDDRAGYCGRPMPGVTLKIVDPITRLPVAVGEVGEVLVGGYSLMEGLYKKERRATFTDDGLYATGDLASMDSDGYVLFHSRMGDMLKVSGANVAPLEVEQCLNAMPQIARSAVVGLPTSERDVRLVAAVQLRAGAPAFDEAAVIEALRGQLSSYKVPKRIVVLSADAMPLTGSNKVRKALLIEQLSEMLDDAAQSPPSA